MIRLTTEQAEQIRELAHDLEATVRQQGVDTPPIIAQAIEIAAVLKEQLDAPEHEGDLVDTVADILNELPPGGALAGVRLVRLRAAVLSPSELVKVKEAPTVVNCSGCGVDLGPGSLFTHFQTRIRCLACQQVESIQIRCKGHNGTKVIALPDTVKKRIRLLMKKAECPTCIAPAKVAGTPQEEATHEVFPLDQPVPTPVAPPNAVNPNIRYVMGQNGDMRRVAVPPQNRPPDYYRPTAPRPRPAGPRVQTNPLFVGQGGIAGAAARLTPEQARVQLDAMDRELEWAQRQWGAMNEAAIPPIEWRQAAADPAPQELTMERMREIERAIEDGPRVAMDIETPHNRPARPGDADYWLAGPEEE